MGRTYTQWIEGQNIYSCKKCKVHITNYQELISKAFQGRFGKAYLFNTVYNAYFGPLEERMLITGYHQVCDMFCNNCSSPIGWKYERAQEEDQKYKEGKYVVEINQMVTEDWK